MSLLANLTLEWVDRGAVASNRIGRALREKFQRLFTVSSLKENAERDSSIGAS